MKNIEDIIEDHCFYDLPENKFDELGVLESEELLDNLGYIDLREFNQQNAHMSLCEGIATFRLEYKQYTSIISMLAPQLLPTEPEEKAYSLTDKELSFLQLLCSLEGEFHLHQISIEQIGQCPLLSRALNYRMSSLGRIGDQQTGELYKHADKVLRQVGRWCSINEAQTVIELMGDTSKFSNRLSLNPKLHCIYFENEADTAIEKRCKKGKAAKIKVFKNRLSQHANLFTTDKHEIDDYISNSLNNSMLALIQRRLLISGIYTGQEDNQISSLSIEALDDLLKLVSECTGVVHTLPEAVVFVKRNRWCMNVNFIISLFNKIENSKAEEDSSFSSEVFTLIDTANKSGQEQILRSLQDSISKHVAMGGTEKRNKAKTKGLKRMTGALQKLFAKVKKTASDIINVFKKAFNWIKNGLTVIFREIKLLFQYIRDGVSFYFGNRKLSTQEGEQLIESDFDSGFDCITYTNTSNGRLIDKHTLKLKHYTQSVAKVSSFLANVFTIIIDFGTPVGWLKLGLHLISKLGEFVFSLSASLPR